MESENQIQKIYGLIGFGLMGYYYYYYRTDSYSNIILMGYICLTLSFIPWFLKSEINYQIGTEKEQNNEITTVNLGHLLIATYYGYKLTNRIDLHSLLGLVSNSLFLTKYKKHSFILLILFYSESILHSHGNIGLISLILFYYYQFVNYNK